MQIITNQESKAHITESFYTLGLTGTFNVLTTNFGTTIHSVSLKTKIHALNTKLMHAD